MLVQHEHGPFDQDGAEGCVGYAGAQGFFTRWGFLGGSPFTPSATFLWWIARKDHGAETLNSGTYMRSMFKKARKLGVADARRWSNANPFETFAVQPSHLAFQSAIDQRFPLAYYRLGLTPVARIDDFKRCLSSGIPIEFGTQVDRPFTMLDQHDYLMPFTSGSVGGHAMLATEYNERGVRGPNSWGYGWGNRGRFALSWDWIASSLVSDAWAVDCGRP